MKKISFLALLLTLAAPAFAADNLNGDFINSEGEKIGSATLTKMENGTLITIDVNLPAGTHAMHIHENGQCDAPDFKTAGGHFNPDGDKHGFDSGKGFHAGDLPNLYVESTNHITTETFSTRLHFDGKDGIGRGVALIIHEKADDYSTDPSGNAGSRIACAVIKE